MACSQDSNGIFILCNRLSIILQFIEAQEQEELDKSLSEATREAARHLKLLGLSKDLNRNWQPSFETT